MTAQHVETKYVVQFMRAKSERDHSRWHNFTNVGYATKDLALQVAESIISSKWPKVRVMEYKTTVNQAGMLWYMGATEEEIANAAMRGD